MDQELDPDPQLEKMLDPDTTLVFPTNLVQHHRIVFCLFWKSVSSGTFVNCILCTVIFLEENLSFETRNKE
jgi:hypothetical protein